MPAARIGRALGTVATCFDEKRVKPVQEIRAYISLRHFQIFVHTRDGRLHLSRRPRGHLEPTAVYYALFVKTSNDRR